MDRFATVLVDPPWTVRTGPLQGRSGFGDAIGASRPLAYPTMTDQDILALPVGAVARDDAHLYLWTINAKVEQAYQAARAWGFRPSTLLVWSKRPMGGGLGGAYGISTEFVLFARRGTLKTRARIAGTWFQWKRPYDRRGKPRHSAKPAELQYMIESVSPGPYLELFARARRPGWAAWGNEVESIVLDGWPLPR